MPFLKLTLKDLSIDNYNLLLTDIVDTPFNGIEEVGNQEYVVYYDVKDWSESFESIYNKYVPQLDKEILEDENWNATWEAQFEPVLIDDFCYIKAPFHPDRTDIPYTIHLSPKMSFGTGHHPTTKQMIQLMRDIDFQGKRVFDFGTGTGILAVLASQLGAEYVIGNDIDQWSLDNALETARNNQIHNIDITLTPIEAIAGPFDIILANINRHILLQYMPQIAHLLKDEGVLLLSGIFDVDVEMITEAAREVGIQLIKLSTEKNWACIRLQKQA